MENFEKLNARRCKEEKMKKEIVAVAVAVLATLVWSGTGYSEELSVDNAVKFGENKYAKHLDCAFTDGNSNYSLKLKYSTDPEKFSYQYTDSMYKKSYADELSSNEDLFFLKATASIKQSSGPFESLQVFTGESMVNPRFMKHDSVTIQIAKDDVGTYLKSFAIVKGSSFSPVEEKYHKTFMEFYYCTEMAGM